MMISPAKMGVLFRKDMKDMLRNPQCLLMAVLSVGFTALYLFMDFGGEKMPPMIALTFGLLMNLSMLPLTVMSMMVAEEKEKNTLRTLMLSNVSAGDFLLSKSLAVFVWAEVVTVILYAMAAPLPVSLVRLLLVVALSLVCMLLFGALVGILSRNQMATGMLSAPLALLFLMPSMFAQMDESIATYARFFPTYATLELLEQSGNALMPIVVLIAWTALAAVLFVVAYRRKRLD